MKIAHVDSRVKVSHRGFIESGYGFALVDSRINHKIAFCEFVEAERSLN